MDLSGRWDAEFTDGNLYPLLDGYLKQFVQADSFKDLRAYSVLGPGRMG